MTNYLLYFDTIPDKIFDYLGGSVISVDTDVSKDPTSAEADAHDQKGNRKRGHTEDMDC